MRSRIDNCRTGRWLNLGEAVVVDGVDLTLTEGDDLNAASTRGEGTAQAA